VEALDEKEEGEELKRWAEQKREGKPPLLLYRGDSCREYAVRERCTTGEVRTVSRDAGSRKGVVVFKR